MVQVGDYESQSQPVLEVSVSLAVGWEVLQSQEVPGRGRAGWAEPGDGEQGQGGVEPEQEKGSVMGGAVG